jgi:hypothetical protein
MYLHDLRLTDKVGVISPFFLGQRPSDQGKGAGAAKHVIAKKSFRRVLAVRDLYAVRRFGVYDSDRLATT